MNWREMLVPQTAILEVVGRGSIVYVLLFLALRYLMKRHAGQVGIADILVIVLISEAAQNAMVGEAKSVVEAAILVGTILFWSYAINWLSDRVPFLRSLGGGDPVPLVEDGPAQAQHGAPLVDGGRADEPAPPARRRARLRGEAGLPRAGRQHQRDPGQEERRRRGSAAAQDSRRLAVYDAGAKSSAA